ncbi:MAG: sodium:alanine symporter family protein [Candidatus Marinimicrobia bacterium]|nr:sodium:alanine symporter family protein [Candidatus Neomarinimicrobiota bacterium]
MHKLQSFLDTINAYIWGSAEVQPWFTIVLLVGTGIYLTIRLKLIQFVQFKHALDIVRGKFDDPDDEGDVTHFQALSTALSATIGIGNIAGVATAIHWGGPGALFWIWVTGLFGMATKYAEITLSHKFRKINEDGSASGGPMYTILHGLGTKFKWLAILFAVFLIIGSFNTPNMVQSNTVASAVERDFGIPPFATGVVLALLVAAVIVGGIRRLARVTSKLVPFMTVLYVLAALYILFVNAGGIPSALKAIFEGAFTPAGKMGGFFGSAWVMTLVWGVKRGLFSNEAGQGSAPIAHAAAKTKEPVREGILGMMGPFLDTLTVCTMTGLVILTTGVWQEKFENRISGANLAEVVFYQGSPDGVDLFNLKEQPVYSGSLNVQDGVIQDDVWLFREKGDIGNPRIMSITGMDGNTTPYTGIIELGDNGMFNMDTQDGELALGGTMLLTGANLTAQAFSHGLPGNWGNYFVTFAVILFAFSTAIAWSYYGDRGVEFLIGQKGIMPYRILFSIAIFVGANLTINMAWTFGDIALGFMVIPNLISILLLTPLLVKMTNEYIQHHKNDV